MASNNGKGKSLESWIWDAACSIRGAKDAPKYKDYILGVRPMRNKWASCSTAGHLNFSDELPALKPELWDYVIVHELLHFSVPNHGRLWKSLMRSHLGDYEAHEGELRRIVGKRAPPRRL